MKKLLFLAMFVLGGFVAVQAQISYKIVNNSSYTWTYTITPPSGPPQTVTIPANSAVSGTWPDFVEPPFNWLASNSLGCSVGGFVASAPSTGNPAFFCSVASSLSYDFQSTGSNTYDLFVKIN